MYYNVLKYTEESLMAGGPWGLAGVESPNAQNT